MFNRCKVKTILVHLLVLSAIWPEQHDCLIITSVRAGDKKFKTISFDSKFLKPLTFEKEMSTTEFRRHRVMRPPKFDIDINIPIKLPLEDEYAQEEPSKPVESNLFFQTGEIDESNYGENKRQKGYPEKKANYMKGLAYADSNKHQQIALAPQGMAASRARRTIQPLPETFGIAQHGMFSVNDQLTNRLARTNARSDSKETYELEQAQAQQQVMMAQESAAKGYGTQNSNDYNSGDYQPQEFVPGGYVNLKLSGPTGGPKMTYADYDREKWAQQLSQTASAMPYPILNYQQLQNFYGGLGTFTNGLAENRYMPNGLLDKIKAGLTHFTNKFHFG